MQHIAFDGTGFPPVVLGFLGLATGYLIWGTQEFFGWPRRDAAVDRSLGLWAIFMSGFCQFATGIYLLVGLTFGFFQEGPLYMAALAFSAYGIHWFVIGWNRYQGNDVNADSVMALPFVILGALGALVFFRAGVPGVGILFIGLVCVYVPKFFLPFERSASVALRAMGLARLVTGTWLLWLMVSTTLNLALPQMYTLSYSG